MKDYSVPLDEPGWWYGATPPPRLLAPFLVPLSRVYGSAVQARYRRGKPYRSRLPVICAGNFTAGGTGKTPLAIHLARMLMERGEKPCFLTRGYGGSEPGPVWIEGDDISSARFGDEALLLAKVAPTLVARNRAQGAVLVEASGFGITVIVMDDGLQNPGLAKDLSIAVVDSKRGFGNGEVIPAGPLRAPIDFQLSLVDAIIVREAEPAVKSNGIGALLRQRFPGPVLNARVEPAGDTAWLTKGPLVAFAGIANPDRFFDLIYSLQGSIAAERVFKDHHPYSQADTAALASLADEAGATLVTTEKDWVRLAAGEDHARTLAKRVRTLRIALKIDDRNGKRLTSLVEAALRRERPGQSSAKG
jgi:tetraacyldisaccharide 4'-kinase